MSSSSKRKGNASSGRNERPSKKPKIKDDTGRLEVAALYSERAANTGASSYLSIREADPESTRGKVPSLAISCIKLAAAHFTDLLLDKTTGELRKDDATEQAELVRFLPPKLSERLLHEVFRAERPAAGVETAPIAVSALSGLFLNSDSPSSLSLPPFYNAPGALMASLDRCHALRSLILPNQQELLDYQLAPLLARLPNLEELNVKGCIKVGDQSVIAFSKKPGSLKNSTAAGNDNVKILNLNLTAVTVSGLKSIIARCRNLQVLKLSHVNGLTDQSISTLIDDATDIALGYRNIPLSQLTSLKLRSTSIGELGLHRILTLCPSLTRLDVGYTAIKSLTSLSLLISSTPLTLEKVLINGLQLRPNSLISFMKSLASLPEPRREKLHTLKLGTLEIGDMTMSGLVPSLDALTGLKRVSLHSNTQLGRSTQRELHVQWLRILCSRCEWLDLTSVPISSRDLSDALLGSLDDSRPSPLETLLLSHCRISDEALVGISTLSSLEELQLEGATITAEGLSGTVMKGCKKLRVLNLTGCRGIPTRMRRDWFKAYDKGELDEEGAESGRIVEDEGERTPPRTRGGRATGSATRRPTFAASLSPSSTSTEDGDDEDDDDLVIIASSSAVAGGVGSRRTRRPARRARGRGRQSTGRRRGFGVPVGTSEDEDDEDYEEE